VLGSLGNLMFKLHCNERFLACTDIFCECFRAGQILLSATGLLREPKTSNRATLATAGTGRALYSGLAWQLALVTTCQRYKD